RRPLDLLRVVADHLHVLVPDVDLHGDVLVIALHHHRRAQLEYARIAGTGFHQIEYHLRWQAGLHAEHHGFGAGDVVDRYQKVGDVFHLAAVAEGADVVDVAAEVLEHRLELLDLLGIAAGVEHQVASGGLRSGTAHRAIEHRVAGLGEDAL